MEPLQPGEHYRCKSCGNLTRFNVTRTLRLFEYQHFQVDGTLKAVEERQTLKEVIEKVECRWCGAYKEVEVIKV